MLMQADFYQLTRDPAEKILPVLAAKIFDDAGRLLVVSSDNAQLTALSSALWDYKKTYFLANDIAGNGDDANQPILLSNDPSPINGARFIALADGVWRDEALSFERAFYLFPPEQTDNARAAWRSIGDNDEVTRNYWRQDGGRWVKGP
jgi:DNA polymerase III subunit chi